jgi:NAD(P)-dependent dehydrogenase (short-subunit alcohol dehydrogenase family)
LQRAVPSERFHFRKGSSKNGKESGIGNGRHGRPGHGNLQGACQDGYTVVANYLPNFPNKDEWLGRWKPEGFDFCGGEGDVSDFEAAQAMVEEDRKGSRPGIDVLVNNAGITRDKFFAKMDKGPVGRGDQHQPRQPVQRDPAGLGGWPSAAGVASSTSRRSMASRARPARPTTRRPRPA